MALATLILSICLASLASVGGQTFKHVAVQGDGRCFFRALIIGNNQDQLDLNEKDKMKRSDELRNAVVDHMEVNLNRLFQNMSWAEHGTDNYFAAMRVHDTYAGEPEIVSAVSLLQTQIHIFYIDDIIHLGTNLVSFSRPPTVYGEGFERIIRILHHPARVGQPGHYDLLFLNEDRPINACNMSVYEESFQFHHLTANLTDYESSRSNNFVGDSLQEIGSSSYQESSEQNKSFLSEAVQQPLDRYRTSTPTGTPTGTPKKPKLDIFDFDSFMDSFTEIRPLVVTINHPEIPNWPDKNLSLSTDHSDRNNRSLSDSIGSLLENVLPKVDLPDGKDFTLKGIYIVFKTAIYYIFLIILLKLH